MKILYVVWEAVLGGHVISSWTIAKELMRRGHDVYFAGRRGTLTPEIEAKTKFFDVDIPFYHGWNNLFFTGDTSSDKRETYFTWKSIPALLHLKKIIREYDIDLVHAYDARSYLHCYPAAIMERKPVLCTLCGGTDPYYDPPRAPKIIVFSEEQKNKLVDRFGWPSASVLVNRARMDMRGIESDTNPPLDVLGLSQLLKQNLPIIMMITSFGALKITGIHNLIDALTIAYEKVKFRMVFIGGHGKTKEEVQKRAQKVNSYFKDEVIMFIDPLPRAYTLLRYATIVIGVGRSAFEGMALEKPTIIVGNTGFAGLVDKENVSQLAYYNFSGRNQTNNIPPKVLAENIIRLLQSSAEREQLGIFGKNYITDELDVRKGISRLDDVYGSLLNEFAGINLRYYYAFCNALIPTIRDNAWHSFKLIFPILNRINRVRKLLKHGNYT